MLKCSKTCQEDSLADPGVGTSTQRSTVKLAWLNTNLALEVLQELSAELEESEEDYYELYRERRVRQYVIVDGLGEALEAAWCFWGNLDAMYNFADNGDVVLGSLDVSLPEMTELIDSRLKLEHHCARVAYCVTVIKPAANLLPPANNYDL